MALLIINILIFFVFDSVKVDKKIEKLEKINLKIIFISTNLNFKI